MSRLYASLIERYPSANAVVRAANFYPSATIPLAARAEAFLDVHEGEHLVDSDLYTAGEPHLSTTRRSQPAMHDGAVLVFVDIGERGRLVAAPCNYFAMIATCDSLRSEWLTAGVDRHTPLRDRADAASGTGGPLVSGAGRAAAIGVSIVTTKPGQSGPLAVLGRRRRDLAVDPGQIHVVPSGIAEPFESEPLLETARRELAEELGVVLSIKQLARRLVVVGIAFDLLRLRPEVCMRLDLTGAEARTILDSSTRSEFDSIEFLRLDRSAITAWWQTVGPDDVTPAAAGALALVEKSLSGFG